MKLTFAGAVEFPVKTIAELFQTRNDSEFEGHPAGTLQFDDFHFKKVFDPKHGESWSGYMHFKNVDESTESMPMCSQDGRRAVRVPMYRRESFAPLLRIGRIEVSGP